MIAPDDPAGGLALTKNNMGRTPKRQRERERERGKEKERKREREKER